MLLRKEQGSLQTEAQKIKVRGHTQHRKLSKGSKVCHKLVYQTSYPERHNQMRCNNLKSHKHAGTGVAK